MKSSQYDVIDGLIVAAIRARNTSPLYDSAVRAEAKRLAKALGRRDAFRVTDGRLQALRRRGVIAFATKSAAKGGPAGWRVVE